MRILTIVLLTLVTGCVGSGSSSVPAPELSASAIGDPVNCIDPRRVIGRRVAGPTSLVFELTGVTYRNDLPEACPGLGRGPDFKVIQLEVTGSQVCSGDSFRAYDPAEAKAVGAQAFPRCRLGAFTPIARR